MKLQKRTIALLLILVVLTVSVAACGQKPEEDGKSLTIYCGLMQDHMIKAVAEFEKETGIKVDAVRMSSGEILGRIAAEKENPKASVWFGGPADGFIQAKENGLLEAYESKNANDIPEEFKDPENFWTGIYIGYLGFASNGKLLEERGIKAPESWDDLLKPEFKGQVVTANPGSSGTAYTTLATIIQMKGEKEGLDYMNKLNNQVKIYTKSGTAPGRMVGQGEAIVGLTFLHDGIKYIEEGMKDIVLTAPKEGTGYEIGAIGLIKGGPDSDAAKNFIDWALTKEAQNLGQTVGSYQFLTNENANQPEQAEFLSSTKLIDYDFKWAGEHRAELVEKWNQKVITEGKAEK